MKTAPRNSTVHRKKSWSLQKATDTFHEPFLSLLYRAQTLHRRHFHPNAVQVSTLLSIKTGGCPENCAYCPQSVHHATHIEKTPLMEVEEVARAARRAKSLGSTRFCMGASGRRLQDRDLERICEMVRVVKEMGLETCVTLGLLRADQVRALKDAGLDFYNHNIDSSEEFYKNIITTRRFEDRIHTIQLVCDAQIKLCCGGIIGMGETNRDRIKMLIFLANLETPPQSVPINRLMRIPGTPLENAPDVDPFDFIRTIALARIMMPTSHVRLAAGREGMSDEMQALCFFAGANSIFYGEKLLTAKNPIPERDRALFERLGLEQTQ